MKQHQFEAQHRADWQAFSEQLDALEQGKTFDLKGTDFSAAYRRLCQQLSLAQSRGYSSHLVDQLQLLALRGHQQLYRHKSHLGADLAGFILAGFPRLIRANWPFVLVAGLMFFTSLLLMGALVYSFDDLIYSLMSIDQVRSMESMYAPDSHHLGRPAERDSGNDWMMFGYYIMHNIGIAFQTFASGVLFGVGSLFYLIYNGLMIGAVAGHLSQIGYNTTFFSFVAGHSAFELSAITIAGSAGLKLGWALLAPGRLSRGDALRHAAAVSVRMIAGVIGLLLCAAFIEAYWSSMTWPAPLVKYTVGVLLWLLLIGYLALAGRGVNAPN